ncbi:MAG: hypothetical protein US50_C0011G0007 [Candidatus Nomurabacteria bacterium GW2011_GWB1_37_5]|uniref:Uncharacterized protein n=1 Tax=Candidatus Nomurabacteria bacterium GW2011_GWB1_37_5 TaxID=1618742 RepID=A0A0G0JFT7_9BACT|nr:MAG: hypothetical protein US50_C0011G0007 [Candidatus Nomurabacteria bacterium GW2011_GWB1_37_5]
MKDGGFIINVVGTVPTTAVLTSSGEYDRN